MKNIKKENQYYKEEDLACPSCWVNEKKVLRDFSKRKWLWLFILLFAWTIIAVKICNHTENLKYCSMLTISLHDMNYNEKILCDKIIK